MSHAVQVAFPYAYRYLSKTGVPEEYLAANLASFECMMRKVFNTLVKDKAQISSDTEAISVPEMYYWEVTFRRSHQHGFFEVGLGRHEFHMCYRSDGMIGRKWSQKGKTRAESFGAAGDVIGCGVNNSGGSVFFTKNGERVASIEIPDLYKKWLYPFIKSDSKSYVNVNLGKSQFKFDIEAYCDYTIRVGASARSLPPEVLLLIAQHVVGDSISGMGDYYALSRLARVCRYWYKLCSTGLIVTNIELHSRFELEIATHFGLLTRTKTLVTREHGNNHWLHAFPSNRSMRVLPRITSWTCVYSRTSQRPGSILEDRIHAHALTGLVRLDIRNRRFKTWSQFAHFIFSFRHLEELDVHNVYWGDDIMAVENIPPRRLAFFRRLQQLRVGSVAGIMESVGYLWLFIAGRSRGDEPAWCNADIPIIAQIVKIIMLCVPKTDRITYGRSEDGICYDLMVYKAQSHSPALKFTLRPANGYSNSTELSNMQIAYRTDHPIKDFPKDLEHLLFRLSHNDLMKVTIVVTLPEESLAHDSREIQGSLEQKLPRLAVRGGLHVAKKILPPPYYANPATNSSRFSRFIHDTKGQLANWDIWREIKVGDYGSSMYRGKEGNIYTSPPTAEIAELAAQFPPIISVSQKARILTSMTAMKRDVDSQTDVENTLAMVEIKMPERRDAFLAMSGPITARVPNEFIDSAKVLLGGGYVVTETTMCNAFLMYLSPEIEETVTISLQIDDPAIVTGDSPSCRWMHSGGAGDFREGVDTDKPSFTPIYDVTYMHSQ